MGADLWTAFVFLSVEERGKSGLGVNVRVNLGTQFCTSTYSLSLFHVLPPVSMFFLCSFFLTRILFPVLHIACVRAEVYVTVIFAVWSVGCIMLQMWWSD